MPCLGLWGWSGTGWDSSPGQILFTRGPATWWLFLSKFSILWFSACSSFLASNLEADAFLNTNNIYLSATAFSISLPFQGSQDLPRLIGPSLPLSLEPTPNAILFIPFSSSLGSTHLPRLWHLKTSSPLHFPLLHPPPPRILRKRPHTHTSPHPRLYIHSRLAQVSHDS